jgi:hypothetical protein
MILMVTTLLQPKFASLTLGLAHPSMSNGIPRWPKRTPDPNVLFLSPGFATFLLDKRTE